MTPFGGPVSEALAAELADKVRQHGVVVWLDAFGHYTAFVDRLLALRGEGRLVTRWPPIGAVTSS